MKLNDIRDNPGARKKRMTVGRGIGSGKGKTCGRGVKGQLARSGKSGIRQYEGGQTPMIRRIPKRGFKNIFAKGFSEINLGRLQEAIDAGHIDAAKPITSASLRAAGVVSKSTDGVRLLGNGELKAKVDLTVAGATKSAISAVEKAGGKVTITVKKEKEDTKTA